MHEVISSSLTAPTIGKGTAKCSPFSYGGGVVSEVQFFRLMTGNVKNKNSIKMITIIFVD